MSQQVHLRTVALQAGDAAREHLQGVVDSLNTAIKFAEGEFWWSLFFIEVPKYYYYWQAKKRGRRAVVAMRAFQEALTHLDMQHTADFQLGLKGRNVILDLLDTGIGELQISGAMLKNRRMANISLSRVRRVVRVLENPEQDPADEPTPV